MFLRAGLVASGSLLAPGILSPPARARSGLMSGDALEPKSGLWAPARTCKGHVSCVTVDPGRFAANIGRLKEDIGPEVKLCVVMKSDAYAHGVTNLIPEALRADPTYIGMTANNDIHAAIKSMEAFGRRVPILRIAPATHYEALEALVNDWSVEEVVGSVGQVEMLSRIARKATTERGQEVVIPVHLNIDTGMGRMGFVSTDAVKRAMDVPGIVVRGVMTHYANAYNLELGEELTRRQLDRFDAALAKLDLPDDVIVHTANSGAALSFPWSRRDMVRVGGALYGDIPKAMNPNDRYRQVMANFVSTVVWISDVPPDTTVGYDSVYRTPKDRWSRLATVKTGYNDGLPSWAYERDTEVLIRGRRFPVVGKTSMNMVVVDVTEEAAGDKVSLGDEVVIFGRQGQQQIRWDDFEDTIGVATGETSLTIGKSNPRIIVRSKD